MKVRVPTQRPGFTLMEVIVVLAIIAIVAAMAIPAFDSWLQSQQLSESVELLRTHLLQARTRAMEESRTYRFAWDENGNRYRMAPDEVEDWPDLAGSMTGPMLGNSSGTSGLVLEQSLQEQVRFLPNDLTLGLGPIYVLFRPSGETVILAVDGSELAAVDVLMINNRQEQRAVRIRSITGSSSVINPLAQ